jgi:hypothetical protein
VDRIVLSKDRALRRIEEVWFEINFAEFARMPRGENEMVRDVLHKALVSDAARNVMPTASGS